MEEARKASVLRGSTDELCLLAAGKSQMNFRLFLVGPPSAFSEARRVEEARKASVLRGLTDDTLSD